MKKSTARRFHQSIAIMVSIGLLWLTVTGALLNHSDDLSLAKQPVKINWIKNWYNLPAPKVEQAYKLQENWLTQVNQHWFWNTTLLPIDHAVQQAFFAKDSYWLQTADQLILLLPTGELVDQIALPTLLGKLAFLTPPTSKPILVYQSQNQFWQFREETAEWDRFKKMEGQKLQPIPVLKASQMPAPQQTKLFARVPSSLNYEKLILDLHNGIFFHPFGTLLLDLFALLIFLMIVTGLRLKLK